MARRSDRVASEAAVVSRRRALWWIVGGTAAVGVAATVGLELVDHEVIPGKSVLDQLDGACDVSAPTPIFAPVGPTIEGSFYSLHRNTTVGYTIGFPPGHGPRSEIPLVIALHGYGENHRTTLASMTPAQAAALIIDGRPLNPMAVVTVDGGGGYWNPHPRNDPMAMITDELIPRCQQLGLGRAPQRIGLTGISMGGYGALAIAERNPGVFSAVAAISPAIWTSYNQSLAANEGAFDSAEAFAAGNVITHASELNGIGVRVAIGASDPFLPGVQALAPHLGPDAIVEVANGCHTSPFFSSQEPPSMAFLSAHLG